VDQITPDRLREIAECGMSEIDPRLAWMAIASARLALFEVGEIDLAQACDGLFDHWSFCVEAERADAAARKRPVDKRIERLRRLLDSDMSLEGIWRALDSNTERVRREMAA
jgi:hypothetical protein